MSDTEDDVGLAVSLRTRKRARVLHDDSDDSASAQEGDASKDLYTLLGAVQPKTKADVLAACCAFAQRTAEPISTYGVYRRKQNACVEVRPRMMSHCVGQRCTQCWRLPPHRQCQGLAFEAVGSGGMSGMEHVQI